jgi:hypothetical protein
MSRLQTATDHDRLIVALAPVDHAFFESEQRYGVGRLERLVSAATLASYHRGWIAYRAAIETGDASAVELIGPKMIAALKFMSAEAAAAGHKPLSVDAWEAPMEDGTVLVVVRTQAEAHTIVRDKSDMRAKTVWTLAELARMLPRLEMTHAIKEAFPGAAVVRVGGHPVASGVQMSEGEISDWAKADPLAPVLYGHPACITSMAASATTKAHTA